ncbi:FUSC family protein [Neobacillus bataviensis]|uniref:FUSC family protein n=1 Tax=Neobacillus bataviensis TaxID=220685 RepID=UPI001CBE6E93|nr:FUSC family protein [Neobacillus bataviensis]
MKNNQQLKKQMENKTHLIWKMALASALSWEIAKLAGSNHPYLAPISVILCLQTTVNQSIRFSYHRMVGTVIGIAITVILSPYLEVNGWTLGSLILIGCFIAKWLKRDETAIHQVALTILLVFVLGHKSGDYPIDRFRDTLIGAIVAVIIHMLIFPPNFTKQASHRLHHFSGQLTIVFIRVSKWIQSGLDKETGYELQLGVKQLLQDLHQLKNLLKDATESQIYNPFAKKSVKELQKFHQKIYFLTQGYSYISAVIDTLMGWSAAGTITSNQQLMWSEQLKVLEPFFQANKNPVDISPPGQVLKVTISKELEKHQFHVTLYHETTSLLKRLNELPRNIS